MQSMTRRGFLRAAAVAAAPFGLANVAQAIDPIGRTRPSHLKLSIAAYSYRDFLKGTKDRKPTMDLFEFTNIAADMGLDAVELTSYYFPENVKSDYLHKLKQHCFDLGLDVSGTSVGNDFCFPEGADRDKNLALVRNWVDNAAELDAPVIRIFAGQKKKNQTEDEAVAQCVDGIKTSLKYAIEKGVTLALENHGGITATPEQLLKLVKAVDSPNFGVNLDTGNFHGVDPYADLAQVAPYAVNVQVKTEINSTGKRKTDADLSRVIEVLRHAKYSGYVVLEYEAAEDPMKAIPRHIKKLRSLIG